ncbi:MAG TPA: hypothetical protein PLM25_03590 [Limnochordia bacterium]|nr:hypothetical protein [Limnochordia bacterium]
MADLWKRLTERQKKLITYLALLAVVGAGLLVLQPRSQMELGTNTTHQPGAPLEQDPGARLSRELTEILNALVGGRYCTVFLTMDRGSRITVAQNITEEVRTGPEGIVERRSTSTPVLLRSDVERRELPLILEEVEPQVRGVLVVVDTAPDAELRLALARAVATALQLPMYRIEVAFKN